MPAQDRARGDQAMAAQRSGQPPHEGGEHGPVRPVQPWPWVAAAQDGDLVPQHEELDVLGGGRAAHQQVQPEHLPEDQVQQPQRHAGIMSGQRSSLVSDPGPTSGTPHRLLLDAAGAASSRRSAAVLITSSCTSAVILSSVSPDVSRVRIHSSRLRWVEPAGRNECGRSWAGRRRR